MKAPSSVTKKTLFAKCRTVAFAAALAVAGSAVSANTFLTPKMTTKVPVGAQSLCSDYSWACQTTTSVRAFTKSDVEIVKRVNLAVNHGVREIDDLKQYRLAEKWALPTRRGGDCEDFVLLKKLKLMEEGIPAERLLIATVLDKKLRGHAVLVVRTDLGDFVLDNLTDSIRSWRATGYTFMKMQNPDDPSSWHAILAGGIADPLPPQG